MYIELPFKEILEEHLFYIENHLEKEEWIIYAQDYINNANSKHLLVSVSCKNIGTLVNTAN